MPTAPPDKSMPADGLRVPVAAGVERGDRLTFTFDGEPVVAYRGESVAAALIASGHRTLRKTANAGESRGVFCGMGVCFDCLVVVDGQPSVRACMTPATEGLRVATQVGHGPGE